MAPYLIFICWAKTKLFMKRKLYKVIRNHQNNYKIGSFQENVLNQELLVIPQREQRYLPSVFDPIQSSINGHEVAG